MENYAQLVEEFLLYLSGERGFSANTIAAYKSDLAKFTEYLEKEQLTQVEQITQKVILSFCGQLKNKHYAPASISRYSMAVKSFFKFLRREHIIDIDPSSLIPGQKLWQTIPQVMDVDEIDLLISQPDVNTFIGSRDIAILETLYATGIRVSELCGINSSDIKEDCIRIMGKGKKERLVPVGSKAQDAIAYYLSSFRSNIHKEGALFTTEKGKRISRVHVFLLIKKYSKQAGIEKNVFPHLFRHSFATHLLDHGADIRIIQELLGHSNIQTTDRYTHVSQRKLQEAFNACHNRP